MLLGGVPSENVHITYVTSTVLSALTATSLRPRSDSPVLSNPHLRRRKASRIKSKGSSGRRGAGWQRSTISLLDAGRRAGIFFMQPIGDGHLGRSNRRSSDLPSKRPTEVRFDYIASWACRFFGLGDCAVPQIELGTVSPDADGAFKIELPDFSADPICFRLRGRSAATGYPPRGQDLESRRMVGAGNGDAASLGRCFQNRPFLSAESSFLGAKHTLTP